MEYKIAVRLPKWILEKWWIFAYLIPPPGGWLRDVLEIEPGEVFRKEVDGLMRAVLAGKELPDAIAPTILNMTDDLMAGRQITIRTGDYIAIQNYLRNR